MHTTVSIAIPVVLISIFVGACGPGPAGDLGDGVEADDGESSGDGGDTWAEIMPVGTRWGPCPTDDTTGLPTLCYDPATACVPADFSEANICLPLDGCPTDLPNYATSFEVGFGTACYPRCTVDADCGAGMVCSSSVADGTPMCAWPVLD
jgi:hypothetical protein